MICIMYHNYLINLYCLMRVFQYALFISNTSLNCEKAIALLLLPLAIIYESY